MPDEPLYDPDRDVPEDLDFSDPDVARAYINHPVTEQLAEDYGREFRAMPPADQQAELSEYLSDLEQQRSQIADTIETSDPGSPALPVLRELLDKIDQNIEAAAWRILELDEG
ncbi:hypothetical protein [Mycolicibacterium sp.]|uniref:hypothetical protein n=1 Tax=Mycolicibacterium sp. TaxID=2320850 RepID=UPI003D146DCB